jgi:hypothetical protein
MASRGCGSTPETWATKNASPFVASSVSPILLFAFHLHTRYSVVRSGPRLATHDHEPPMSIIVDADLPVNTTTPAWAITSPGELRVT